MTMESDTSAGERDWNTLMRDFDWDAADADCDWSDDGTSKNSEVVLAELTAYTALEQVREVEAEYQAVALDEADPDLMADLRECAVTLAGSTMVDLVKEVEAKRPYDLRVVDEMQRERARREARGRLDEDEAALRVHQEESEADRPYAVIGGDVLTETSISWLVEDRIHDRGVGQVVADPYVGKTIFALGLALAVANGLPEWNGYRLHAGEDVCVVYVAAEGGAAFRQQVHAWVTAHPGTTTDRFILIDEQPLDLASAASMERFERWVDRLAGDRRVALVVFDTQNDVIGETEEDGHRLGQLLGKVKQWSGQRGCFSLFLQHTGLSDKGRPRGSSAQRAKDDVLVLIKGTEDGPRTVIWDKVKGRGKPTTNDLFKIASVDGSEGAWAKPIAVSEGSMAGVAAAASAELGRERLVIAAIKASDESAMSKAQIAKAVGGNKQALGRLVDDMLASGALLRVRGGKGGGYRFAVAGDREG